MHDELLRSTKLFVDEMTAPVLDPGRGRTKKGYFWVLARDDRPCAHSQSSAETASPFNRHTPNRWSGQKKLALPGATVKLRDAPIPAGGPNDGSSRRTAVFRREDPPSGA